MSDYDYGGDYGGDYDGGGVAPPKKAGMSKAKIGGVVAALLVVGGVVALAVVLSSGGGGEEEKISEDPIKADDGKCIKVLKAAEMVNRDNAVKACEEIGGKLIGDKLQERGIFDKFTTVLGDSYAWTEVQEDEEASNKEGGRVWVWGQTGERFAEGDFAWCEGEPNDSSGVGTKETCTVVTTSRPSSAGEGKPCLDDRACAQKLEHYFTNPKAPLLAICEVVEDC